MIPYKVENLNDKYDEICEVIFLALIKITQ